VWAPLLVRGGQHGPRGRRRRGRRDPRLVGAAGSDQRSCDPDADPDRYSEVAPGAISRVPGRCLRHGPHTIGVADDASKRSRAGTIARRRLEQPIQRHRTLRRRTLGPSRLDALEQYLSASAKALEFGCGLAVAGFLRLPPCSPQRVHRSDQRQPGIRLVLGWPAGHQAVRLASSRRSSSCATCSATSRNSAASESWPACCPSHHASRSALTAPRRASRGFPGFGDGGQLFSGR
jgi:hypothetical protein